MQQTLNATAAAALPPSQSCCGQQMTSTQLIESHKQAKLAACQRSIARLDPDLIQQGHHPWSLDLPQLTEQRVPAAMSYAVSILAVSNAGSTWYAFCRAAFSSASPLGVPGAAFSRADACQTTKVLTAIRLT